MQFVNFFIFLFLLTCNLVTGQIRLVKDIVPGTGGALAASSHPGIFLDGSFIFPATTPEHGTELWISDGTEAGTLLLKDIFPGTGSSMPQSFVNAFDRIYFAATTPGEGTELWVTDGTPEGTELFEDINSGPVGSDPVLGAVFKDYLYFTATADNDRELWRFHPDEGASFFVDVNPLAKSNPRNFATIGDKLYFAANDYFTDDPTVYRDQPYVTDGTPEGTVKLYTVTGWTVGGRIPEFVGQGDYVYFLGDPLLSTSSERFHQLYRTDGTPEGTEILQAIDGCQWLTPFNNSIFFFYDFRLVRLNLSETGIANIASIHNDAAYHEPNPVAYLGNEICFPAQHATSETGVELYFSRGTPVTTRIPLDIHAGPGSSYPEYIVAVDDHVVFAASSSNTDRELYISDGSAEGTRRVMDLVEGDEGSDPVHLVSGNGVVFFYATTPATGYELYIYEPETVSLDPVVSISFTGRVYPSPSSGTPVRIEWASNEFWQKASLYDVQGTLLQTFGASETNFIDIPVHGLVPGQYTVRLVQEGLHTSTVLIVQ